MKATIWKYFKIFNYIIFVGLLCFFLYKGFVAYQLAEPEKAEKKSITIGKYLDDLKIGTKKVDSKIYFYGNNVDNYVLYNGRLWQIIKKDNDNVYLITKDNQTSIAWGDEIDFHNSLIDSWLNHDVYYDTIEDLSALRSNFELELASVNDYKLTGEKNSFMNNQSIFYLNSDDDKLNYVDALGNLQTTTDTTLGLGVRPVIAIRNDSIIMSGQGTIISPLIIGNDPLLMDRSINDAMVGSYVSYQNDLWQISYKDNNIKLAAVNVMQQNNSKVTSIYGESNDFETSEIKKLLETFNDTVEWNYYIDSYGLSNNYNYKLKELSKDKIKTGLLQVGDILASNIKDDYFLLTAGESEQMIMSVKNNGVLFADKVDSKLAIRQVIKIDKDTKITEGMGTIENPYIIN